LIGAKYGKVINKIIIKDIFIGLVDYWITGLVDYWIIGLVECGIT